MYYVDIPNNYMTNFILLDYTRGQKSKYNVPIFFHPLFPIPSSAVIVINTY